MGIGNQRIRDRICLENGSLAEHSLKIERWELESWKGI